MQLLLSKNVNMTWSISQYLFPSHNIIILSIWQLLHEKWKYNCEIRIYPIVILNEKKGSLKNKLFLIDSSDHKSLSQIASSRIKHWFHLPLHTGSDKGHTAGVLKELQIYLMERWKMRHWQSENLCRMWSHNKRRVHCGNWSKINLQTSS